MGALCDKKLPGLVLSLILFSCATPEQECTYGRPVEHKLALLPGESPVGATGTSLVLRGADDRVRFVGARAGVNGPFTIRGRYAFVPSGLVAQVGEIGQSSESSRLVDSRGNTILQYPAPLNCMPLTLGPELTVCNSIFGISRLKGDELENLISAEGRFEPQFDGLKLCVATYLVNPKAITRPATLAKATTYCGVVTETAITFDAEHEAATEVLLSGGRTFLATDVDGGVLLSDADDSTDTVLLPADTRLNANSCRIWAENSTGIFWLDPRSLKLTRAGDSLDAGTRFWSTNFSGAQVSGSNELQVLEIEL